MNPAGARYRRKRTSGSPVTVQLGPLGLQCPCTIWKIEGVIDLSAIREKWLKSWNRLWCSQIEIPRFDDETEVEFQDRSDWVGEYVRAHQSEIMSGEPLDETLQQNVTITSVFNSVEARNPRTGLKLISEILLDILSELWQLGHESAAQSLWHSVRQHGAEGSSSTKGVEGEMLLPDDVGELLQDAGLRSRPDYPVELFDLDWDTAGNFHQQWLFTRVMSEGSLLWYGEAQAFGSWGPPASPEQTPEQTPEKKSSVISRSRTLQIFRLMLEHVGTPGESDEYEAYRSPAAQLMLAQLLTPDVLRYPYPPDLHGSHAIFDVDGPADIAIAYDARRETWPHPHDRAMSACWVVESAGDACPPKLSGKGKEVARATGNGGERVDDHSWDSSLEWKVVDRVKGFWPLMEVIPPLRCHFT